MNERILIVDDEEKIRKMYLAVLNALGFKAVAVASAVEANEKIRNNNIDLVLLDIRMPEVDGNILHETIRAFHKGTKVIVTSVYPVDEQRRVVIDADSYFDKSEGIHALVVKIKEVLHANQP